jgi:hypothetical protein
MLWPAIDLSIRAVQADALFASALQRRDKPEIGQVRRAIAAAIAAFGDPGCAQQVAQEFGDHPEAAVIRMRWARIMASAAFADSVPESGPGPDPCPWSGARSRSAAKETSGPRDAGRPAGEVKPEVAAHVPADVAARRAEPGVAEDGPGTPPLRRDGRTAASNPRTPRRP